MFDSRVDTTFAIHAPGTEFRYEALRTGTPYLARHMPWYRTELDDEHRYYLTHADFGPEGTTWKILASLEQWGTTWCKIAVILQDDVIIPNSGLTTDLTDPGNEVIVPAVLTGV